MAKLEYIGCIGSKYAGNLRKAGIRSPGSLLKRGSTAAGRSEIAKGAGLSEKLVTSWVNHIDMMRVRGIGSEYAELLTASGVPTLSELGKQKAEKLYDGILSVNDSKRLVNLVPGPHIIVRWIEAAKKLEKIVK